jgi:hypothetical protein
MIVRALYPVAIALLLVIPASAGEPDDKAVNEAIDAFLVATKDKQPDPAKLVRIQELRTRVILFDKESTASMALELLKSTTAAIAKDQGVEDKVKAAAEKLKQELLAAKILTEPQPASTEKQKFVAALGSLVDTYKNKDVGVNSAAPNAVDKELRVRVLELAALLDRLSLPDPDSAPQYFGARLSGLSAMLKVDGSATSEERYLALTRSARIESSPVFTGFRDFQTAAAVAFISKAYVHVVRAWGGDLAGGSDARYRCDATRAMRKICQSEQDSDAKAGKCSAATKEFTNKVAYVDLGYLCGFDPYPAYYDHNRGLVVEYACLPWTEFHRKLADLNPGAIPTMHRVTLRRTDATIFCPWPDIGLPIR